MAPATSSDKAAAVLTLLCSPGTGAMRASNQGSGWLTYLVNTIRRRLITISAQPSVVRQPPACTRGLVPGDRMTGLVIRHDRAGEPAMLAPATPRRDPHR